MLVRFSCANYRSFRENQTLTLEPKSRVTGTRGRTFETSHRAVPHLTTAAVIYGANSGGKSNLIKALDFLQEFVVHSARSGSVGDVINISPYKFDSRLMNEPSEFEVSFIKDGSLFQYGIALTEDRVFAEWLYETPQVGRIRHIFNRDYDTENGRTDWYINPRLKGEKKTWQEATRENASFLSTAVQLNSTDLRPIYDWFSNDLRVVFLADQKLSSSYTSSLCGKPDQKRRMLDLFRYVDPDVVDFEAKRVEFDESMIPSDVPNEIRKEITIRMKEAELYETAVVRIGGDGAHVKFDLDEESTGANRLFSLIGPLVDVFEGGMTLVVDELDGGLHPLALKAIVSMFFDPLINKNHAQLVLTCHESTLLRDSLLRSDQVWFVDKTIADGSRLLPLSKFKPRSDESFFRGYLGGRYGALPVTRALI